MASEGDPDDLYGDLQETNRAASTYNTSAQLKAPPTLTPISSVTVQSLEKRVEELAEENRVLKRNIGTLYRTSKAEIKRKDDEIARLLLEIEQLKE